MVKGISKRVVVVRSPGNGMFEQAIFILKGEQTGKDYSSDDIIREACMAAENYSRAASRKKKRAEAIPPMVFVVLGAVMTAAVWAVTLFI